MTLNAIKIDAKQKHKDNVNDNFLDKLHRYLYTLIFRHYQRLFYSIKLKWVIYMQKNFYFYLINYHFSDMIYKHTNDVTSVKHILIWFHCFIQIITQGYMSKTYII